MEGRDLSSEIHLLRFISVLRRCWQIVAKKVFVVPTCTKHVLISVTIEGRQKKLIDTYRSKIVQKSTYYSLQMVGTWNLRVQIINCSFFLSNSLGKKELKRRRAGAARGRMAGADLRGGPPRFGARAKRFPLCKCTFKRKGSETRSSLEGSVFGCISKQRRRLGSHLHQSLKPPWLLRLKLACR